MRKISEIIIHCSATKDGQWFTAGDIRAWHKQRGFADIGYHYVVLLDGTIQQGRDVSLVGAHCHGHNAESIGICYIGGCDYLGRPADTRTWEQRKALRNLVAMLKHDFPAAAVYGHRDFAAKDCPCFDATREYKCL